MKILKTKARKIILIIFVIVFTLNTFVYADYNPPRRDLEKMIEEVAVKRGIPAVILKSIARVESVYEHFNSDGSPKITGTSVGLMQVNNRYGGYDTNKLKYDIMYNIEAGADVLLNKWSMSSYQSVSCVGNMDPNVLENWYFALWAYNGWAQSNNPNMLSSYAKKHTYQQLIYDIAKKEYGQTINNIDFSYLPQTGKPSRSLVVPTPAYTNSGNIVLYEKGDYVRTDGVRDVYQLRDEPAGKYIYDLAVNSLAIIDEGPVLKNGYYWYKVIVKENISGWIERNLLTRTGDTEHGRYIFEDISYHWGRKLIMDLYNEGIVSEAVNFNPDNIVTKEEFLIFVSKSLDKVEADDDDDATEESTLHFTDAQSIHPWAFEYIQDLEDYGLLNDYKDELKPLDSLTRKEAARIIDGIFRENDNYKDLDINTIFKDLSSLNEEEIKAIKTVYTNGIISGKGSGIFSPDDYLTRAEAAAIMVKICDKLSLVEN